MGDPVVVKIKRVLEGESATRPVEIMAFVNAVAPEDGYIVQIAGAMSTPLYIRDSDIEKARKARDGKEKPVTVDAKSWSE